MGACDCSGLVRARQDSLKVEDQATAILRVLVLLVVFVAACFANIRVAYADPGQTSETLALSSKYAAYDAALRQTALAPFDPRALAAFAKISVEIGDLEGAISALERLLLINGDLPEVKLELGVLYFRLGSFETARVYLQSALASANATARVKDRANLYLKAKTKI